MNYRCMIFTLTLISPISCGYGKLSFSGLLPGESEKKAGTPLTFSGTYTHFGPAAGESCDAFVKRTIDLLQSGGLASASAACDGQDQFGVYVRINDLPGSTYESVTTSFGSYQFSSLRDCLASFPQDEQKAASEFEEPVIAIFCYEPTYTQAGSYEASFMSVNPLPLASINATSALTCTGTAADNEHYEIDVGAATGSADSPRTANIKQGTATIASLVQISLATIFPDEAMPTAEPAILKGANAIIFKDQFGSQANATNSGTMFTTISGQATALSIDCQAVGSP